MILQDLSKYKFTNIITLQPTQSSREIPVWVWTHFNLKHWQPALLWAITNRTMLLLRSHDNAAPSALTSGSAEQTPEWPSKLFPYLDVVWVVYLDKKYLSLIPDAINLRPQRKTNL